MSVSKIGEFEQAGALFDAYFKSIGQLEKFKQQMALTYWAALVGERVASHTQPVRCESGLLVVEVDSSAWMNQLQFMKREMVVQLNQYLKGNYVKDVKFVIARR